MTLAIPANRMEDVFAHAVEGYPFEVCGFLIGTEGEPRAVLEVRRATNVRTDDRRVRYTIDPREQLTVDRELVGTERQVIGYYHSHPDHPAEPSEYDRTHAWPGVSYLIVRVEGGTPREASSWRFDGRQRVFVEEPLSSL